MNDRQKSQPCRSRDLAPQGLHLHSVGGATEASATRLTYREQLRDPRWQKRSIEVKILHDFVCEDCGRRDKRAEVHHNYYIRTMYLWEYGDDLLMCLCEDCHEFRQGREEAMYITMARAMRRTKDIDGPAWDILHDYFQGKFPSDA